MPDPTTTTTTTTHAPHRTPPRQATRHAAAPCGPARRGPVPGLPRLRRLAAGAARSLLVALLPLLWLAAGPVVAQGRPPGAQGWHVGRVAQGEDGVSWWYRQQATGAMPAVESVPPGLAWGLCPGPEEEAQTCTVAAAGPWRAVLVGGAVLWRRGDTYLPLVTR